MKTLLTFGADVNPLNEFSQTPLDIAIDKQCCTIIAILVSIGGKTSDKIDKGSEEAPNMLEPFDPVCMVFQSDTDC